MKLSRKQKVEILLTLATIVHNEEGTDTAFVLSESDEDLIGETQDFIKKIGRFLERVAKDPKIVDSL